jgi:hypothetical protein
VIATLQTVHVRVNDAATGKPTPVRLRITDEAGNYYAPFGRLAEFATGVNEDVGGNLRLGHAQHSVIDGTCEIALPPGPILIEISKGLEYRPLREELVLGAGKMALRLSLERWLDLRPEGWYAGDGRAHFLSPHAALQEAAAEDLAVVNLLALHWQPGRRPPTLSNLTAFSGQQPALEMPGHQVVVNTLNTSPLGQLALLNCHRVVYPLNLDRINWTMADWCDQCHRKGGLVAWPEHRYWPHEPEEDTVSEGLADLVLGKVDALEVDLLPWQTEDEPDWYTLLNAGLRVPLLGSSRKKSNLTALGCVRTYAKLPAGQEFSYKNWIEAVRAGHCFVTNGPLVFLTVNGTEPGGNVRLPPDARTLHVHAEARSLIPFGRLEIIHNGDIVAEQHASGSPPEAVIDADVALSGSGWWAARCWNHHRIDTTVCPQAVAAHTSPVYAEVEGRPNPVQTAARRDLIAHLERAGRMLQRMARQNLFDSERERERLKKVYDGAVEVLTSSKGVAR